MNLFSVLNNVKDHCDIIDKSTNRQRIDNSPSDEEEYFTPPSTPPPLVENVSDEEPFEDSFTSETDIYIDG